MSQSLEKTLESTIARQSLRVIHLDSTESTNTLAKELVLTGEKGELLIVADSQTLGRGRSGKSFFSPSGRGLYMTQVLRPEFASADFTLITAAVSVAVSRAIEKVAGVTPSIKWVNDIFLGGKKLGGILCESVFSGGGKLDAVIIGIGINLTGGDFPPELESIATSLGGKADRNTLCAEIAKKLFSLSDSLYSKTPNKDFLNYYRSQSCVLGNDITYTRNGQSFSAVALSILDGGELKVRNSDGSIQILSGGEISLRL